MNPLLICKTVDRIIYPTSARNLDGTEMYILNTPEKQQSVRISVCQEKARPCHVSIQSPYHTQCEQRVIYRELLAYQLYKNSKFQHFVRVKFFMMLKLNQMKNPVKG